MSSWLAPRGTYWLAGRVAMKNVAITGFRIHESRRLCTMKNVAFPPSVPWETSPLAMRNVALVWIDRSATMRNVALVPQQISPVRLIRGTERQLFGLRPPDKGLPWKMSL
jgi:hypothetical protein